MIIFFIIPCIILVIVALIIAANSEPDDPEVIIQESQPKSGGGQKSFYYERRSLFSPEHDAFDKALTAATARDYRVLTQIPLDRLVKPSLSTEPVYRSKSLDALVSRNQVHFVLLDRKTSEVACCIHLFDSKQTPDWGFLAHALKTANIPLLIQPIQAEYKGAEIEKSIQRAIVKTKEAPFIRPEPIVMASAEGYELWPDDDYYHSQLFNDDDTFNSFLYDPTNPSSPFYDSDWGSSIIHDHDWSSSFSDDTFGSSSDPFGSGH